MIRSLFLLLLLAFAGCRKPQIHSYIAPKDNSMEEPAMVSEPLPQLSWTLPKDWEQIPNRQMSVASFAINDPKGAANIVITPLPNLSGQEEAIVNMWREQVQLGPLSGPEMQEALQPAEVAGESGKVFEITGANGGKPTRTIAAMLHRGDRSWFFKVAGDDAVVTAHKPAFLEFVKSVRFSSGAAEPAAPGGSAAPAAAASEPVFNWTVPPAWTVQNAGAMQVAKFSVPVQGEAKADVSVSIFPSESGGTLANVNRWRQQIGLEPIDEAALKTCTGPLDTVPGGLLIDLTNGAKALLGAIVPREGQWFFYKMMGDTPAVEAARQDFISFAKSKP